MNFEREAEGNAKSGEKNKGAFGTRETLVFYGVFCKLPDKEGGRCWPCVSGRVTHATPPVMGFAGNVKKTDNLRPPRGRVIGTSKVCAMSGTCRFF